MRMHTCLLLIETAIDEKWIKYLAFFHLVKYRYRNSCIYNYKSRMHIVAWEFNICVKTLYTYVNTLKIQDLVYEHSNNLIFKSIKRLKKAYAKTRYKTVFDFKPHYTLKDLEYLLYLKILENKGRQQAFMVSLKGANDRFKNGSKNSVRTICESFAPSFSYRTIAKILNISENKAFCVILRLNELNVLRTQKQKPKLIKRNIHFYDHYEDEAYEFVSGGNLYECYGNRHHFLDYPIYLKTISYKKFIALKKKGL